MGVLAAIAFGADWRGGVDSSMLEGAVAGAIVGWWWAVPAVPVAMIGSTLLAYETAFNPYRDVRPSEFTGGQQAFVVLLWCVAAGVAAGAGAAASWLVERALRQQARRMRRRPGGEP